MREIYTDKTIYELFYDSVKKFGARDCLAESEFSKSDGNSKPTFNYYSYTTIDEQIKSIACYFLSLGLKIHDEGENVKIGLWMSTSFCMRLIMMVCHKLGYVVVPVYDAMGVKEVANVFELSD